MNRCEYCANYMNNIDRCKYCQFEYEEEYVRDDWDILNLDEEYDWTHKQILNRLHAKGIMILYADMWGKDMAYLLGNAQTYNIAKVLGMHEDAIYNDFENGLILLNLYQERKIRKMEKEWLK